MLKHFRQEVLFVLLSFLFLMPSCTEPDLIGLDLQPLSQQPGLKVDTLTLETFTVPEDSLIVWSPLKNLIELPTLFIGSYDDPYLGKTQAGFVSQIRLGNTITSSTFAGVTTPDSVVLSFLYRGIEGDSTVTHHISVYELDEVLYTDSTYYSSRTYSRTGFLGHVDLIPEIRDSVLVGSTFAAPQLRIPLDTALGGRFMREYISNPGLFASNTAFIDFFNGVLLVDSADGVGSIVSLPSTSGVHRLTLYFSGNKSYEFLIDVNAVRLSYFMHQYLPSVYDNVPDNQLVVASMAGLKDSLVIKNLTSLYDDGPVSVSSARLIIKLQDGTTTSNFLPHNNLLIFGSDSTGKNITTADATETSAYYGGAFDDTKDEYIFNVARYVQQTVKKVVENGGKDYGLFLVAGGSTSNAKRTVLQGQDAIKLIVTTTKINP
ncbi:MAG: DUF4270 family protein [Bacteroidetes bacterium]|nr:DUF4270 family protein [Bacteroidota bacterium]